MMNLVQMSRSERLRLSIAGQRPSVSLRVMAIPLLGRFSQCLRHLQSFEILDCQRKTRLLPSLVVVHAHFLPIRPSVQRYMDLL